MKTKHLSYLLFLLILISSCDNFGNRENAMYGIVYRENSELPLFKNHPNVSGSLIENRPDKGKDFKFAIAEFDDSIEHLLFLEQLLYKENSPNPKYMILDSINVYTVNKDEYVTYCMCRENKKDDPEIIALLLADEDVEFYTKILKAWRADTKTGTIIELKTTANIDCNNPGFGLDECGLEE